LITEQHGSGTKFLLAEFMEPAKAKTNTFVGALEQKTITKKRPKS
jgi:hypothetical protein